MLTGGIIVLSSFAYVGLLFAIAYYGDKRADEGRSIIANPGQAPGQAVVTVSAIPSAVMMVRPMRSLRFRML